MKNIKEHIEKHINKHGKITVYSQKNIPLDIYTEPYISRDGATAEFEMDCKDMADYCNMLGLRLTHNN